MKVALLLLGMSLVMSADQVEVKVRPAPDFGNGDVWLDQGAPVPHHISGYRGHVVLIDFWEYTCINCIRDFAVVKRWYGKYHPYGFDVIGVHYCEFNIGFDVDNVKAAAQEFRLPWPIVADQKGTTWKAYGAQGWPDRFLVDAQGDIVMQVFGEGHNREMKKRFANYWRYRIPRWRRLNLIPRKTTSGRNAGSPLRRLMSASCTGAALSRTWPATMRARPPISNRRILLLTEE